MTGSRPVLSTEFLGLLRHAQGWYEGMKPEDRSPSYTALTAEGVAGTIGVARRLRELLADAKSPVLTIYHVGTEQSRQTAKVLYGGLDVGQAVLWPAPLQRLSPEPGQDRIKPSRKRLIRPKRTSGAQQTETQQTKPTHLAVYPAAGATDRVEVAWRDVKPSLPSGKPCVIVGHEPQMSWLLGVLVRRDILSRIWQPPFPPLAAGELALVEPRDRTQRDLGTMQRPRYVFSPTDRETRDALIKKVDSKMKTAGALGAFLTAVLTWGAGRIADANSRPRQEACATTAEYTNLAYGGLLLLAIGVSLYFVCLFLYDRLIMPSRFWGGGSRRAPRIRRLHRPQQLLRPPASDVRVLYEGMMRAWRRTFIPATVLGGAGIALLAVGLMGRCATLESAELVVGGGVLTVAIIAIAAHFAARSSLGIAD